MKTLSATFSSRMVFAPGSPVKPLSPRHSADSGGVGHSFPSARRGRRRRAQARMGATRATAMAGKTLGKWWENHPSHGGFWENQPW